MSPIRITSRARRATAAALVLATAAARPAGAQSTLTAQCVGGALGCEQVDFFYTLAPGAPALTATTFQLALSAPGWVLAPEADQAAAGEAADGFGPLLFAPSVAGQTLTHVYSPFAAMLDPTLRVRALFLPNAFATADALTGTGTLYDDVGAALDAAPISAAPAAAVPEPAAWLLLATGLGALAAATAAARRRRRA